VVPDPNLAGLLTVALVSALSFACALLRTWLLLEVERERQATARLAIWWFAGRPQPSPAPKPTLRSPASTASDKQGGNGQ
jgi:hypothetical protein